MGIKLAEYNDLHEIAKMWADFVLESGGEPYPDKTARKREEEAYFVGLAKKHHERDRVPFFALVAYDDLLIPYGFLVALPVPDPNRRVMMIDPVYIEPHFRGGTGFKELTEAFEKIAWEKGADVTQIMVKAHRYTDRERNGYKPIGVIMEKEKEIN